MPSTRPRATFKPFSPSLDIEDLVESTPNFEWVIRIHQEMIEQNDPSAFETLILKHVVLGGKPLVIEGYQDKLDKTVFSAEWLRSFWGSKTLEARDLSTGENVLLSIQHYLRNMTLLTNQWNERNYKDDVGQRLYLKDIDCHPTWATKIRNILPSGIFYMNERSDRKDEYDDKESNSSPIVKAGDLMSSLPLEMRAENLMCYIGHEGTYTPAHREMCATIGHNIMVEASIDGTDAGKRTTAGSSIWFMTETKDLDVVSEYWLSRLGHDIEVEKHFAQINAWKQAPFTVYVVEQKPGDFIIIPPVAPHQVWNRGTRTMKVAWNRTTVDTLELALKQALFKARMVCRDEQYKTKAVIYYSLQKYSNLLKQAQCMSTSNEGQGYSKVKVRQLLKEFKKLHSMYTAILLSESFLLQEVNETVEMVPFDSNITCSYCRCNIFNRFLTCPSCIDELVDGTEDTYDVCMDCYAMGRSCACISKLRWVEQWPWEALKSHHERWRNQILKMDSKSNAQTYRHLDEELEAFAPTRTIAQICQMELTRRPFHDIHETTTTQNRDYDHDDNMATDEVHNRLGGNNSNKSLSKHARCHVDCNFEPKWKQTRCNKCGKSYCFGVLFRAYDEMPQDILADPKWECPSCRKMCSCRKCSRRPGFKRYIPKGTLLGHNTKLIADPRSVESLVDFSHANLAWIRKAGDDHTEDTLRLRRKIQQAESAKMGDLRFEWDHTNDGMQDCDSGTSFWENHATTVTDGMTIDPLLTTYSSTPTDGSLTAYGEELIVDHPEELRRDSEFGSESGSRVLIPAGGIEWEDDNAYQATDAITYNYPDIALPAQPQPAETTKRNQANTSATESVSLLQNRREAEKAVQKRKRTKPNRDDQSYTIKKAKHKLRDDNQSAVETMTRYATKEYDSSSRNFHGPEATANRQSSHPKENEKEQLLQQKGVSAKANTGFLHGQWNAGKSAPTDARRSEAGILGRRSVEHARTSHVNAGREVSLKAVGSKSSMSKPQAIPPILERARAGFNTTPVREALVSDWGSDSSDDVLLSA